MTLTIGSLFSGIGGLELGLERAGLGPVLWQCEIDPFARSVLALNWPSVKRWNDVTQPRSYVSVDLICGGFPCQDVSSAGNGRGIGGVRSGLWRQFASIVAKIGPRVVVVENVASGKARWLLTVRRDLHMLGYDSSAYAISAEDIGAPHKRKRVFVVAYLARRRRVQELRAVESGPGVAGPVANRDRQGELAFAVDEQVGGASPIARLAADLDVERCGARLWRAPSRAKRAGRGEPDGASFANAHHARREGPGPSAHEGWPGLAAEAWRPPVGGLVPVVHGVSGGLAGRRRRAWIRSLGNCVVPQCAEVIGQIIMAQIEEERGGARVRVG